MMNYQFSHEIRALWQRAVALYQQGHRDCSSFFGETELDFIRSIGASPQEVYDFAEDWVNREEPDFITFALLADIRRNYFHLRQGGKPSEVVLDPETLPAKTDAVKGIEWLPRIIPKAKAKLRGELHPDIMFGCGGDCQFFRTHDIHPATFLRAVEMFENDDDKIIEWVAKHSKAPPQS